MALPLNTGGSCSIIFPPSLNVTGSGYYTTAKRNHFILFDQIRSYLFYSLKIPSLNPIVRGRNTRRFEKSFNFLFQKIFPSLIERKSEDYTVFGDKVFNKVHKKHPVFFDRMPDFNS